MLKIIITLIPYIVACLIAAWITTSLHKKGKAKNIGAAALGAFFFWLAVGKILSELILRTATPLGIALHLLFAIIGALVYTFLGIHRRSTASS